MGLGVAATIFLVLAREPESPTNPHNIAQEIFWGQVVYSFGTFGFVFFAIPGLQNILTHSTPSGWDKHGYIQPLDYLVLLSDYEREEL